MGSLDSGPKDLRTRIGLKIGMIKLLKVQRDNNSLNIPSVGVPQTFYGVCHQGEG